MKILVISSSRADFGLLLPVIRELHSDNFFKMSVCELGTHISGIPENLQALRAAGVEQVDYSAQIYTDDSMEAKAGSVSIILTELTTYLGANSFDAVMILGDRFETLAVAFTATLADVPVIHLVGGDVTSGSIDDNYRHAITKLAKIHFVTNISSLERVVQLGEERDYVHNVGSPGLDDLEEIELSPREELERILDVKFCEKIILVTFHPDTINPDQVRTQTLELIRALEIVCQEATVIITGANFDSGFLTINEMLEDFANNNVTKVKFIKSLGSKNYFSCMNIASVMVGNSSSGYYEAPSFGLPVVDLGDRQRGRIPHELLQNVQIEADLIVSAINAVIDKKHEIVKNPYWDGKSSVKIKEILRNLPIKSLRMPKLFSTLQNGEIR